MIHPVMKFLAEQMNAYIDAVKKAGDGVVSPVAVLQNIGRLDEEALKSTNKLFLTLVNFSEEATMKNNPGQVIMNSELVRYQNPPVNLNLYILVNAVMTNYENALIYLSHAMTFFQGKSVFTRPDSVTQVEGLPENFRLIADLYSLSFEQSNYLWSTLGGKQQPFAVYKVRLVSLERESTKETRGVIRQVRIEEPNNP